MTKLVAYAGGKTATLKALGLMALMAKAGLFLPVLQKQGHTTHAPAEHEASSSAAQHSEHVDSTSGAQQSRLIWFDKVLADVGDGQDLQQSLSTFSGHVRRLCGVLATCTPRSLVLLDEVRMSSGSGSICWVLTGSHHFFSTFTLVGHLSTA